MAKLKVKALLTKLVNSAELAVFPTNAVLPTVAAGAIGEIEDVNIKRNGYKAIGVISIRAWGTGSSKFIAHGYWLNEDGESAHVMFNNFDSASKSNISITIYVLYQKLGGYSIE